LAVVVVVVFVLCSAVPHAALCCVVLCYGVWCVALCRVGLYYVMPCCILLRKGCRCAQRAVAKLTLRTALWGQRCVQPCPLLWWQQRGRWCGRLRVPRPPLAQARPRSQKSRQNSGSTHTLCLDKPVLARDAHNSKAPVYLRPYITHGTMHRPSHIFCLSLFTARGIRCRHSIAFQATT